MSGTGCCVGVDWMGFSGVFLVSPKVHALLSSLLLLCGGNLKPDARVPRWGSRVAPSGGRGLNERMLFDLGSFLFEPQRQKRTDACSGLTKSAVSGAPNFPAAALSGCESRTATLAGRFFSVITCCPRGH